jgi:hypothetical protein
MTKKVQKTSEHDRTSGKREAIKEASCAKWPKDVVDPISLDLEPDLVLRITEEEVLYIVASTASRP